MTKVAAAAQLPASNALHFGGAVGGGGGGISKTSTTTTTTTLKRKTPSELRGELLKLKKPGELVDESPFVTSFMRNADEAVSGPKKSDTSKQPRFTRMDDHFPVTKISRLLSRKGTSKDNAPSKCVGSLKNSCFPMESKANQGLDNSAPEGGNYSSYQNSNLTEKCTSNTFKHVKEISLSGKEQNGSSSVDMGRALKGLVSCETRATSDLHPESLNRTGNIVPHSFCSEMHIPGHNFPLDLTLKTCMRLLSSSSVNWFHRLMNCGTSNNMDILSNVGLTCSSEPTSTSQSHSWVYPQSILPHAAIAALTSVRGGQTDFLSQRQQAWEDAFRSLYYMLRKKICKIFYVCSAQFVVMFTANDGPSKTNCSCYAYVSQSTKNLRSLLKEHGVSFSMPLCRSKVEEATAEDLVELSQIEKHNLGQTRAIESLIGVDNTPQSLLMLTGNKNVHALYDFLLSYRYFLASLTGGDVPVLYSPVTFKNAALSTPEVRCKQVRRADYMLSHLKDSNMASEPNSSSAGICYSVEIKDAYLPPWVVSGICNAMRSNGGDFQASFSTESTSVGLNVGLDIVAKDQPSQAADTDELPENGHPFGIPGTGLSLHGHSAFLKGFKYGDCSYKAFLSPVE